MLAYFVSAPSMHSNYAVAGSPSIRLVWLVSITTVSFQNWFLKQSLLKWKHEEHNRRGVAIKCAFKYWHFQNWRHPPPCLPINRSIDQTLILGLQFGPSAMSSSSSMSSQSPLWSWDIICSTGRAMLEWPVLGEYWWIWTISFKKLRQAFTFFSN